MALLRRLSLLFFLLLLTGCIFWLQFGCLEPTRGFEAIKCNTTSARILQSLYREDFFVTFQVVSTGQLYPEEFLGCCEFNKKEFAGCDVHFRSICIIGQVWDCLQKGNDPPRASLPNVQDSCVGSMLFIGLTACGVFWFFLLECRTWKCSCPRRLPYGSMQ